MSSETSDHLANERTFLAWVRTSISVIVFGFVVAKFGITLREFLRVQDKTTQQSGMSLAIGLAFMCFGIFMAIAALMRYHQTRRRLENATFAPTVGIITILGNRHRDFRRNSRRLSFLHIANALTAALRQANLPLSPLQLVA